MVNLNNLFSRIDELGLNAKKVADDTGISTGNISDWKSGRSMPTATKLGVLADYLDCTVDYLLGRTNIPEQRYDPSRIGLVNSEAAYQVYLADVLHASVSKATPKLTDTHVANIKNYINTQVLKKDKPESATVLHVAAYDGSDDEPAFTSQEEIDAAPDLKL